MRTALEHRLCVLFFEGSLQVLPVLLLTTTCQLDDYEIAVRTGSQPDAGTDVPVTFTLRGSGGRSVSITVDPAQSSGSTKPFRPSALDVVKVCAFGVNIS